ncbi:tRNA-uridine aminocarboxypropyltransferase [Vibrio algarum]|uniref:tRNA-uridine aminocarboxypropyltransferase n=1 Tax=Vibrio algarum TaxID=3020714 RepID=A0ABT4YM95_9VIBR|nr:DTW domain-containing protein [Vibrio sp. KJ40-1]MDB1122666.1 DTW domain-containing protein [Vibrio sp. KJ40-1]
MRKVKPQLEPCPKCGFRFNCFCKDIPDLQSAVKIVLLMHPNELNRDTNTGKLVSMSLSSTLTFTWDRVSPPEELIQLITCNNYQTILLFPGSESTKLDAQSIHQNHKPPMFILLDATWQEAKKMVRKSPWLQALTTMALTGEFSSNYSLRRNQTPGNLCTCETVSEVLKLNDESANGATLDAFFDRYLSLFQAEKSGHKFTHLKV